MNRNRTQLRLRTPEGISFAFELAHPAARLLAVGIDSLCVMVASMAVGIASFALSMLSLDASRAVGIVAGFAIATAYPILAEWLWRGQTLGKRVLRLRVIDQRGLRLTFGQVVFRNLLRTVDLLPAYYLLGGLFVLFTPRCQRLGDLAAGTVVVWTPPIRRPDLAQILGGKYNLLRDQPLHAPVARR